jgi:hypothetical protein
MKKIIAVTMACSLALMVSARAQDDNNKKNKDKQTGQSNPGKAAKVTTANPHGPTNTKTLNGPKTFQTQHTGTGVQNNAKLHSDVKVHTNDAKVQTDTKLQTNAKLHANETANKNQKNKAGTGNEANNLKNANNANQANNVNKGNQANKNLSKNSPEFKAKQQKFQAIHQQHVNFKAQPNQSIASVKFNKNFHIQNSQNWKGQKYAAFNNYHPQWHNQGWWHSHHNHIILVGGGWYFWNAGYWYPAWGYNESEAYYPYDGPIYVGQNPAPPDQIIADVQSSLQEQGYYSGEVDGLLGPLTRAALADYQQAQGLEPTSAMDEPTLESLGMS